MRRPRILPVWNGRSGQYNSGWSGDEWLADVVPAANQRVLKFKLGDDLLHRSKEFDVEDDPSKALEALQQEIALRAGRLALLGSKIAALPEAQQRNEFAVGRIMAELKSQIAAHDNR